jgi:hypothetical protein
MNYDIVERLVDDAGREWAKAQGTPAEKPTAGGAVNVVREDARLLTVPADAPPGTYHLELSFVDPATGYALPASDLTTGAQLGERARIASLVVGESVAATP